MKKLKKKYEKVFSSDKHKDNVFYKWENGLLCQCDKIDVYFSSPKILSDTNWIELAPIPFFFGLSFDDDFFFIFPVEDFYIVLQIFDDELIRDSILEIKFRDLNNKEKIINEIARKNPEIFIEKDDEITRAVIYTKNRKGVITSSTKILSSYFSSYFF